MLIPRYWARATARVERSPVGGVREVASWRWSETSAEEAAARAAVAVSALAARLDAGERFPDRYLYGDRRPLREEIVREIAADRGSPAAAVTRNSYGCLVLNTARAAFVDVDLDTVEPPRRLGWTLFSVVFGASAPGRRANETIAPPQLLHDWLEEDGARGARVYRTAAGFRYLLTGAPVEPASDDADRMLAALGSDPLYRRLCRAQNCFRARLTPKPWRCGARSPRGGYPRLGRRAVSEFERWLRSYDRKRAGYAACRFVGALGAAEVAPEIAPIVELHDRWSDAQTGLPLA